MMAANGMQPFLLSLNEQQAHEAGNLLSAMLLQQVRAAAMKLMKMLTGRKPLSAYPGLASAIKMLEERGTPEALANSDSVNKLAASLGDVGAQYVQDNEGEEVFG